MSGPAAEVEADRHATAMEKGEAGLAINISPTKKSPATSSGTKAQGLSLRKKAWMAVSCQLLQIVSILKRLLYALQPVHSSTEWCRKPVVRKLEACPEGYPNLAAFVDSDENFMLYRRFGFLQARVLLEKQDELRLLEKELDRQDMFTQRRDPNSLRTRDLNEEKIQRRRKLLQKIEAKFCEYAKVLCAAQQLMAFNKPAEADYVSVERYIHGQQPLVEEEASYIYRKEDMITLRPGREHAWLDAFIERLLRTINCQFVEWIFCSSETKEKSTGEGVYYTRQRIDRFVVSIITLVILALLIIPIYILYNLSDNIGEQRNVALHIGVLLVFTLTFSAILSLFTRARRHEILGASAA
ncbi:hypothetical protein MMC12_005304 [Toensbergia leucococca]|nr:hypothetical protein [Toensbergia leucococca]